MLPKTPQHFAWLGAGLLTLAWLAHAGWLAALYRAGPVAAVLILVSGFVVAIVAAVLWPVAARLLQTLVSGDPYWIDPREFDTQDDEKKTQALMRRLAVLEIDAGAHLWQDRENSQFWISRRFDSPGGEFTRFKPLSGRAAWRGMEDDDWDTGN